MKFAVKRGCGTWILVEVKFSDGTLDPDDADDGFDVAWHLGEKPSALDFTENGFLKIRSEKFLVLVRDIFADATPVASPYDVAGEEGRARNEIHDQQ